MILISVFITSVMGYRFLGGYGWIESVWMVVVTISTVGFGERSQLSPAMQLWTVAVILMGVSASVYSVGGFIQVLLEGEVDRVLGKRKMMKDITGLRGHVVICGFGRMGQDLAKQLGHRGMRFVVVDMDGEKVKAFADSKALFVVGDATLEEVLKQANIDQAKALVTALPTDAENVFIALTARNLRADIQIIAKAEQSSSGRKLRQAGADKVVMPHQIGAQHMERMISRPSTADLFELFAEASHLDMELDELAIDSGSPYEGKTLATSLIRKDYNLLVVGIKNPDGSFHFNPLPETKLSASDTLLVMGPVDNINRMKQNV